jgi:hypothetical protein
VPAESPLAVCCPYSGSVSKAAANYHERYGPPARSGRRFVLMLLSTDKSEQPGREIDALDCRYRSCPAWSLRVWELLAGSELLRDGMCCTLNFVCDFLSMRDVD